MNDKNLTKAKVLLCVFLTVFFILIIELGRRFGAFVPIPFLLLYVSVVLSGAAAGRYAGSTSGILAAAYVVYAGMIGFGPPTLTGGEMQILLGCLLYIGTGLLIGRIRDHRDQFLREILQHKAELEETSGVRTIELKKSAEALRSSEERYSLAMRGANDGLWDWDLKNDSVYYSPRWCTMLGYGPEELAPTLDTWSSLVAPEDKERVLKLVEDYISGITDTFETEFRMRNKNGSWVTVLSRAFLVREGEDATRLVGTHVDMTKGRRLEEQLRQAQKMETIGTLAGGVAHELNNILTPIQGLTELAMEDVPEETRAHKNMGFVLQSARRAGELVDKILSFSHQDKAERRPVDLRSVVQDEMELLGSMLPATIRIQLDIDEVPIIALADETQIHQVLMNLASNAAHAMQGKVGELAINLSAVDLRGQPDCQRLGLESTTYAKLSIKDTGHGMDEATKERIYEPFFTTKEVGEGTGMGLAMIHGIVTGHDGAIDVSSEPSVGTTFDIYLPLMQDGNAALAANG